MSVSSTNQVKFIHWNPTHAKRKRMAEKEDAQPFFRIHVCNTRSTINNPTASQSVASPTLYLLLLLLLVLLSASYSASAVVLLLPLAYGIHHKNQGGYWGGGKLLACLQEWKRWIRWKTGITFLFTAFGLGLCGTERSVRLLKSRFGSSVCEQFQCGADTNWLVRGDQVEV